MDLSKIKHLLKQGSDRFIVIENGEPEMVVMSFREYQKFQAHTTDARTEFLLSTHQDNSAEETSDELRETEFLPPDAQASRMDREVGGFSGVPVRLEDIRLEDLPI